MSFPTPTRRAWAFRALVWILAGCGDPGGGSATYAEVDTLGSGVVVVRNTGRGLWQATPAWTLEPELVIGSASSEGPDAFGRVQDVETDQDRNVFVLDALSSEVRVFDAGGAFVRSFGRHGQGPGELANPIALEWGPLGRLWLPDRPNGRYEVFLPDGTPSARFPYAPGTYGFGDRWTGRLLSTFVAERSLTFRLHLVRRRVDGDMLVPVDTVPVPPVDLGETVAVSLVRDGRRLTLTAPVPLQPLAVRELRADGGWWLSHPGRRYRIARLDSAGDTALVIEMPLEPVPVSEADWAYELERMGLDGAVEDVEVPTEHPPVTGLMTMPDGHLLVTRRGSGGGHTIDVFDASGFFQGTMAHSGLAGFQPMTVTNDAILGTTTDVLGVQRVVRWRINRSP